MNFTKPLIAVAFAVSATSAFAGGTVDTYGRASTMPGGPATIIADGCSQDCHVGKVQGRAALNYIKTPRPAAQSSVHVRNADADSVYGRA